MTRVIGHIDRARPQPLDNWHDEIHDLADAITRNLARAHTITLSIELPNGNDGRGHAHWNSTKRREAYEATIRPLGLKPAPAPCIVLITRILGKGQSKWDADSVLRGGAKELIDALVAVGVLPGDGPKHIVAALGLQDATRRKEGPATEVTFIPAEELL